jgi:hypothetical protein
MSASQRRDTPARRFFCRLDFLRFARAQLAVLTIEDNDDEIGDADTGRAAEAFSSIYLLSGFPRRRIRVCRPKERAHP